MSNKNKYRSTRVACYLGYLSQAAVNNLAPILFIIFQNEFSITYEMLGRLIFVNFGVQIAADLVTMRYADRIGYRRAAVIAHFFCGFGLICLSILPRLFATPYVGLTVAVVLYATGGGIIEVLISPIIDSLPSDSKASSMSLAHSFYCWGQMGVVLISTLLISFLGAGIWIWLPVIWSLIPLYNMLKFIKVPLVPPIPEEKKDSPKQLFSSRLFILALIMMMCAGSAELSMSQWSSLFAEKALKMPKLLGDVLGPCLFAAFMGTGRALYGIIGGKIHIKKALMASSILCVICYSITIFVPIPIVSLLGLALCGYSVSLMWPGTFSLTASKFPMGGTLMFALLAVFGDLGASIGPWLAGLVSDLVQGSEQLISAGKDLGLDAEQLGLRAGLLVSMIFPIMMIVSLYLSDKGTVLQKSSFADKRDDRLA